MELNTHKEIDDALTSGQPLAVVGLNGRGLVQLQLPPGNDYIVLSPDQAEELAGLLRKHAARAAPALDAATTLAVGSDTQ
jgi:hypothetical protein